MIFINPLLTFLAARAWVCAAEFPLYHVWQLFVNSFFAQKTTLIFPAFCALSHLAIGWGMWYYNSAKGKGNKAKAQKNFEKSKKKS